MHLTVKNAAEYDGKFPSFRQPSEIGHFSLDSDRNFRLDDSQLKYLIMPSPKSRLDMNLSDGYRKAIKKDFSKKEKIDCILRWLLSNRDVMIEYFRVPERENTRIDFVSFRGLLTVLSSTIYENKDDWLICATKYKSTIYLCAFDTEQDIEREMKMKEKDKLMSSWGYKFEQYMTADTASGKPDTNAPVNEREEYCIVLKGRLDDHVLLYSAEVDGVDPEYFKDKHNDPKATRRYMELKTSRIITTERQDRNFRRFKLLKWWAQSFLIGIPKIICGFRDDEGFVQDLQTFQVNEIPKMAERCWSPSACLNFCTQVFDFFKQCVVKDDPRVVYKFYYKPGSDITCEELPYPSEYQVLPDWFISQMENKP